jgi:hypothetical protein
MANVRAKRSLEQAITDKVKSGCCLICGKNQNDKRGLCNADYLLFVRTLSALPKNERFVFEEHQIKEGRILPVGQLREIRKPNPFTAAG